MPFIDLSYKGQMYGFNLEKSPQEGSQQLHSFGFVMSWIEFREKPNLVFVLYTKGNIIKQEGGFSFFLCRLY
jgi:hypothetical protein